MFLGATRRRGRRHRERIHPLRRGSGDRGHRPGGPRVRKRRRMRHLARGGARFPGRWRDSGWALAGWIPGCARRIRDGRRRGLHLGAAAALQRRGAAGRDRQRARGDARPHERHGALDGPGLLQRRSVRHVDANRNDRRVRCGRGHERRREQEPVPRASKSPIRPGRSPGGRAGPRSARSRSRGPPRGSFGCPGPPWCADNRGCSTRTSRARLE